LKLISKANTIEEGANVTRDITSCMNYMTSLHGGKLNERITM